MTKAFLFFLLVISSTLTAQPTWTWLQGEAYTPGYGIYGVKGVANPANRPAGRSGQIYWVDSTGKMWLFGGNGVSVNGTGFLNDLWRYDPAGNQWTWVNGDLLSDQLGVYKQRGVASPGNSVTPRSFAQKWIDAQGNLWVYGGVGYLPPAAAVKAPLNDLWRYTPSNNNWTWMGGDTIWDLRLRNVGLIATYGQQGVEAAANKPAPKNQALTWTDRSGNLWMYGGLRIPEDILTSCTSDLWRYSVATDLWAWMGGDTVNNQAPRYGTMGQAAATSKPGARTRSTTWTDRQGNLWLFGGNTQNGNLKNDLWMYATLTGIWTWMGGDTLNNANGVYGTKGIALAGNRPGARYGMLQWTDTAGHFWFFSGRGPTLTTPLFNDFWMYDPASMAWTWMAGDSSASGSRVVYGTKGIPSDSTYPPSSAVGLPTGTDASNNLWLAYSDFYWTYSPASNQWTRVRGDTVTGTSVLPTPPPIPPVWGSKGVPAGANTPGGRRYGTTWTDPSGSLWLYGGQGSRYFNDLWKYQPAQNGWTWISGDSLNNVAPKYGTQNMPSDTTTPGSRMYANSWTAADGTLWLFGGMASATGKMNDIWKFSPVDNKWTWIRGGINQSGVYTSGASNNPAVLTPGARVEPASAKDGNGDFWVYGGQGNAVAGGIFQGYGSQGKLNDLWKFSPGTGNWTFLKGNSTTQSNNASWPGEYGTKGVPAATNLPSGRSSAASCIDGNGNLWLFGGITDIEPGTGPLYETYLNDLWKYTPSTNMWTWMSGDNTFKAPGNYGTLGVPSPTNKPGYRKRAVMWSDGGGNIYLFGGNMDTLTQYIYPPRYLNDLWKYTISTGLWTWLGGSDKFNWPGTYGTLGVPATTNQPGGRDGSYYWTDNGNNLWVYGGYGNPVNGQRYLNDMMKLSFNVALPVKFSQFTARKQGETAQLNWTTAQEQNSHEFNVERSTDGTAYIRIGTVTASGTANLSTSYAFTDFVPVSGDNFYRITEVDRDGKSMYSAVQKVYFGDASWGFSIITNPAQHELTISVVLPVEQVLQVQVRDAAGHLLISRQASAIKGNSRLRLPVDQLAAGTYFLQVGSGNLHGTKVFVKQ